MGIRSKSGINLSILYFSKGCSNFIISGDLLHYNYKNRRHSIPLLACDQRFLCLLNELTGELANKVLMNSNGKWYDYERNKFLHTDPKLSLKSIINLEIPKDEEFDDNCIPLIIYNLSN